MSPRLVLVLVLVLVLGSSPGARAAPPEPIRVSFGSIVPEGTPWADELKAIKTRLEKDSGGRLKVALFLSGRRGNENDMLTELRRGKLQGAGLSTGALAGDVPEVQSLELPFLFRDAEEVDAIVDGPIGKKIVKRAEEKGISILTFGENGWRSIATRGKPVKAPEDVKGLRVRAQESPINVAFWRSLDAAATQIPLNEVLPALQTGVIDGFDQTPVYMTAAGWHTEIQHLTLTEHSYQGAVVIYNKRFLDGLPEDLRALVLKDADLVGRRNRANVRAMAKEVLGELEAAKVRVHRLSDAERDAFRKKTEAVYEQYKATEAGALVTEIQAALAELRATKK